MGRTGQPIGDACSFYKSFAYSREYNVFPTETGAEHRTFLANLSKDGNGALIEKENDFMKVFDGFVTEKEKIIDPKPLLIILSIILFLADIFVRKFKFKWLHEIVKDRKEKRKNAAQRSEK